MAIGIVSTHVHVLLSLHPCTNLPRLIQRLKGASARIANRDDLTAGAPLRWAEGYSIQTVGPSELARLKDYVLYQALHHPSEATSDWAGDDGWVDEWRKQADDAARLADAQG